MSDPGNARTYPTRPFLAVSAAIFRDGRVLIVRRARPPAHGLYTLPGGGVEVGENLHQAVAREVREETGLAIEPVALGGVRADRQDRVMTSPSYRQVRWLKPAGLELAALAGHTSGRRQPCTNAHFS